MILIGQNFVNKIVKSVKPVLGNRYEKLGELFASF